MKKQDVSKCALLLSLFLAASSSQLVHAEEPVSDTASSLATNVTEKLPSADMNSESSDINATTDQLDATLAPKAEAITTETSEKTSSEASQSDTMAQTPVEGQSLNLRILSTTDLHTNLVNYDYYQDMPSQKLGLAKTAVLIDEARKENSNVVLVDNGDILQGTPLGTYKAIVDPIEVGEKHPMYAALEKLGFDASTLGNHEFNYGLDYLEKAMNSTSLPIVNANVIDLATNKPLFDTYKIIPKTFKDTSGQEVTVNIGITGIVPPQIMNWDKAHLDGKVKVMDSVEAVKQVIPEMRKAGADIVLVLSHSGIGDDQYEVGEENVGYQIAGIEDVDAVVTGHSHAEFPSGKDDGFYEKYAGVDGVKGLINGTPVTMAGKYGDHLGLIDLEITFQNGKWSVNKDKSHAQIRKIDTKSELADASIVEIAKEAHDGTVAYVRKQVGTTSAPITSYFALVKDDPSIQIVNNAQRWYAAKELAGTAEANLPLLSAAAPFKAGTRNDPSAYTDIPAGPIAIKNVADLYLYDNVTAILKVNGADLKEWLEMAAGQFNTIDPSKKEAQNLVNTDFRTYNFDVIDGVTYEFDVTQANKYDKDGNLVNPNSSRVRNLKYMGKEVTADQEFIVITNNYRASGNFPGVKNATVNRLLKLENRQAIIDYIVSEKTINPSADNNWYFADTIKGLDLRFLSADKAKDLIANSKDIAYVGPSATAGFGDFTFTYVKPDQMTGMTSTGMSQADRQAIHQLVAKVYKETRSSGQMQASLPKTGQKQSTGLAILGMSLVGLVALFKKPRKQN